MLRGILILLLVGLLGILSHRRTRLEEKIYKNIPLADWLIGMVFPIIVFPVLIALIKNILGRPNIFILAFDDIDILAFSIFFLVYAYVGNTLHFTSKILSRYIVSDHKSVTYKINEMFHGKLSHYLFFISAILFFFSLPILEINHPLTYSFTSSYRWAVIAAGIVFGVLQSKAVFYPNEWFGGYTKPIFILLLGCFSSLWWIFHELDLSLAVYPISLFIMTGFLAAVCTFLARQLFIFSRLNNKRRLRFLARILSAT